MLLYALTWPAVWLERRGLTCPAVRYQKLIAARLGDIAAHGDPARFGAPGLRPSLTVRSIVTLRPAPPEPS
jgi:hypothetical protein